MPVLYALLLCLHVLAAAYWVGGMAVMHFAVRPAALERLEPAPRLRFMAGALARFFTGVVAAIATLLLTGALMIMGAGGFGRLHWNVHLMLVLGLLMMAIFGHLRFSPYRRLQAAVAAQDWASASGSLHTIRRLVALNLLLGTLVFAVALVAQVF